MKRKAFIRKWRLMCKAVADSLEEPTTSCSPSRVSRKASGNRSARRMRSRFDRLTMRDCMKSSNGGSRHRPSCPARKPRRCCSGHCSLRVRSPWRKVDAWQSLAEKPSGQTIDRAARCGKLEIVRLICNPNSDGTAG
jgi:hypothetical protein